jgi:hypothetical protein
MAKANTKAGIVINAVIAGEVERLTPEQQEWLSNVNVADDIIRLYGVGKKSRALIAEKLDCELSTASKWIREAQLFIGSTSIYEKNYWRSWAAERIQNTIIALETAIRVRIKTKDADGNDITTITDDIDTSIHPKYAETLQKMYKELRETLGYDKEDQMLELPPSPDEIVITGDPKSIGIKPSGLTRDEIFRRFGVKSMEQNIISENES